MDIPTLSTVGAWRPRVLVLPPSVLARNRTVGGGERYALEYAKAMAAQVPTTLALFDTTAGTARDGELEIRTFRIPRPEFGKLFPVTRETWRAFGGFDVVHVMWSPSPPADTLLLSALLRRQWTVLTDVGGGAPCATTYLQRIHPRLGLQWSVDGLAHLSKYASTLFRGFPHPGAVLFGGVNPEFAARARGEPSGYALFVGRLLRHKGVLELVRAVDPDVPLRVVGRPYDGAYVEALKAAAIGKQVRFFFEADDDELRAHYAGANVVLQVSLPSETPDAFDRSELLGLVALEGMACGKPVIVTRTTSLPELVVDGVTGFVVPPRDPEALRLRVAELVRSPARSAVLGAAAAAHVQRQFTWAATVGRGLEFYRMLAEARLRGGCRPAGDARAGVEGP